ncbi:MAG: protein kinase [Chlamydiia bacterium]|nr:protein kinase [Chlamydiia bacterium]
MTCCVGESVGFEFSILGLELSDREEELEGLIAGKLKVNNVAELFFSKLQELGLTGFQKRLGAGAVGVVVQLEGVERFENIPLALKFFEFSESHRFSASDPRGDLIALSFSNAHHLGQTKGVFTFDGEKVHLFETYDPQKQDGHIVIATLSKAVCGTTLYGLAKSVSMTPGQVKTIGRQIAEAILSIHKEGYAHKDIHAENILVESRSGGVSIEMIDFGLAGKLNDKRIGTDWRKFGYILGELGGDKLMADPWFFDLLYSEGRGLLNGKAPYAEREVLDHPFFKGY